MRTEIIKQDGCHYLIKDNAAKYFPWICCRNYNATTETWSYGMYYRNKQDAIKDFDSKYWEEL